MHLEASLPVIMNPGIPAPASNSWTHEFFTPEELDLVAISTNTKASLPAIINPWALAPASNSWTYEPVSGADQVWNYLIPVTLNKPDEIDKGGTDDNQQ
jgi:hypothetical protein